MNRTMSGWESLAQGVIHAGTRVLTSYPGAPVTKVVEGVIRVARQADLYVEWSSNEKVAFETALGCAAAGARAVVAAKHVGINHILDPLMTANLTGIRGGLMILAGDDPGSYSSQNEQDSRPLGAFAEIPVLEPGEPQQGYDLVLAGFELSERIGLPVMLRFTTDFTASQGPVRTSPALPQAKAGFTEPERYKCLPAQVVGLHHGLHQKTAALARAFDKPPYDSLNRTSGRGKTGIIAAGRMGPALRSLTDCSRVRLLELATIHPLPEKKVLEFLKGMEEVYVLEEVEPFVEDRVRIALHKAGLGIAVKGKTTGQAPWEGDLNGSALAEFIVRELGLDLKSEPGQSPTIPSLQPLGQGCPYRLFFALLKETAAALGQERPIVVGETGCLVRLNNPPLQTLDLKFSMGSAVGTAHGLRLSGIERKIVAAMGDSVFFHTGINGLLNAVNAGSDIIIVVMDNQTVALTGFQERIGSGRTAQGREAPVILPEDLARGLGIEQVVVLDSNDREGMARTWQECLTNPGLRFIVVRGRAPISIPSNAWSRPKEAG